MKNILTSILLLMTLIVHCQNSKIIKKELAFEKADKNNVFYLSNINGSITAEAYEGDKVLLEAEQIIVAKTEGRLQKALSELQLGIIDRYDTIIVYVQGACGEFVQGSWRHKKSKTGWNYNWNNCDYAYDFKFNFKLKIPNGLNVFLSTINHGDIEVSGMKGKLDIHNVNGAIALKNVGGSTYASTINGNVTLDYVRLPDDRSYYYTLNGDITANYPQGMSADMSFKSYNGDFYTNLEDLTYLPMTMKASNKNDEKGVAFKVESKSAIRVREGGVALDFETFNGDVFVKEK